MDKIGQFWFGFEKKPQFWFCVVYFSDQHQNWRGRPMMTHGRPVSQVDQVDSSRLGPSKSGQVSLKQRCRRNFLASSVSLQVISSRLEKST